jgi:lipid-A-disaccharide synthase
MTNTSAPRLSLGMVAGEKSGDMLASAVLQGLKQSGIQLLAQGVGGPAMAQTGFNAWWSIDALSVRGYAEVLRQYARLWRMRRELGDLMLAWRPALFMGVDAPDFNMGLAQRLRAGGVRCAHFISPSIWAWRRERIEKIRKSVDHMLLIFPFEQAIYDQAGIPATYVGHPLADVIPLRVDKLAARHELGLGADTSPVLALLPGSRPDEIRYLARPFLQTAQWLHRRRPDLRFVMPAASPSLADTLSNLITSLGLQESLPLTLVQGQSHAAMAAADSVLVASGTATLEAALLRRPMVIAYRMAPLSYRIMRGMGYLPWIGLPNILCQDSVVPEFVQEDATPDNMGAAVLAQIDSPAACDAITRRFEYLHHSLRRDCAKQAAQCIRQLAGV